MQRSLSKALIEDIKHKLIIISGPRQCGKTYLVRNLLNKNYHYLNFDIQKNRKSILSLDWDFGPELVVFDELHKMKKWKSWLKGLTDDPTMSQKIIVTGSAKLNTYKKVGDSLAGRYFSYRLYPFDLKEVLADRDFLKQEPATPNQILDRLLSVSGFPEPFLKGEKGFYRKWQKTHLDNILKNDILETEPVRSIKQIEILAQLLIEKVGSLLIPISYEE